jgi:arylsulfatase A-like enzyme
VTGTIHRSLRVASLAVALALAPPAAAAGATSSPNIVLVSIDTLRADHLPSYGYPIDTAPFMTALAADGILFEEALVPLPNTTPSHGSMLTSLAPAQHGSVSLTTPLSKNVDTLAAALARKGYATGGFVAVSHIGRAFNFDKGFEAFTQPTELVRPGAVVNADALAWVDEERRKPGARPLFLFVHYFDMHAPYGWWKDAESARAEMSALPLEERVRRYDESIRHVDDLVRGLYTALSARGILDDAVLCITSDHGEQIGDHGLASGHADIYRETVRVPLVFVGTRFPSVRVGHPVSSMDIGVSLLRLAGAQFAAPVAGRNILPKSDGALARLIYRLTGGGSAEERNLLVTGNPSFTRSIALAQGKYWLIRNLDVVYEKVRIGPAPDGPSDGLKAISPTEATSDHLRYTVPDRSYAPFVVTVDHRPASHCQAQLVASIPPRLAYFTVPARATPVRLQFAAARLDQVSITTKPPSCGGTVAFRVDRPGSEPPVPDAAESVTELFAALYAQRKAHGGDELYDVSRDPGMTSNLIASAELQPMRQRMERTLRELYEAEFGKGDWNDTARVSREELEKLKSLGYLR